MSGVECLLEELEGQLGVGDLGDRWRLGFGEDAVDPGEGGEGPSHFQAG